MDEGNSLAEEEVVNMIKEWRIRGKDAYSEDRDESEGDLGFNILEESVIKREKITELEEIFEAVNNEMEWEKIQAEAATIVRVENGFDANDKSQEFKNWRDWREMTDIGISTGRKFETERREDGKEEEEG
ncbi:hypothetical protein C1646_769890 [Rhizophagus diaphanus]|nr:hypothetical protein C1646_769890 [Rhizophagus diaphanus] [Rhizophagus sp. MUCL 43196]